MDIKEKKIQKNPEETSNILNQLFFGWMYPVFWKGAKRELEMTDMYDPLKTDESEYLGDALEGEWKKELVKANEELTLGEDGKKKSKRKPNLLWAIARVFWAKYMLQGVLMFIQLLALRIIQPILQEYIIGYFDPDQKETTRNEVLLYAGGLVAATLGITFIIHHNSLRLQQIGMRIRVACCSIIYRKVLRLDQAAMSNAAAGRVANLISNDVARFDFALMFLHYIWIMPLQVALIGYIMWNSSGVAAFIGIGTMLLQSIPIQGYMSRLSTYLRSKIAVKTDARVQLMNELISGIQVIKMYAWEKPFELIVSKIRAQEMKMIAYSSYMRGLNMSIIVFSERFTLFLTLIIFVIMGNPLSAEVTFTLANLFNILQFTCAICFPQAIILFGETTVSLKRLTEFLLLDEVKQPNKIESIENGGTKNVKKLENDQQLDSGIGIEMVKVAANWVHGQLPPTLCELSMKVESQSLTILVGPVGSGKSSLLHLVLGELSVGAGSLSIFKNDNGVRTRINSGDIRISYASQEPWLFSGSVRSNILFGQPFDKKRYQEVTRVCALQKDFEQLSEGDLTFVGERGTALSGGQKARINLARAVYRDAELYLLDDPLSAVDPRVGRQLFEDCIKGFLKNKTRILVTHQLQFLQQADTIVVLNRGTVERQDTYQELASSNFHILKTEISEGSDEDEKVKKSELENTKFEKITKVLSESSEISEVSESFEENKDVVEEEKATGQMSNKVYRDYFAAGSNLCSLIFFVIIFITGQIMASGTDYWVTYWTNQETLRAKFRSEDSVINETNYRNVSEDQKAQLLISDQWFDEYGLLYQNLSIYIYTACIMGCIFFVILRSMLLIRICMNASRNIHNSMFSNLLLATMRFFNTNPSGRILNRFSKDVGAMDEFLPKIILETFQIFGVMLGIFTMVIIVNYYMVIPTIIISVTFYTLRVYYLKTAQAIKRLEGIAKSPVFSHMNSTLDGLATIRSRGSTVAELLRKEFDQHQDTHTAAWYLNIAATSAFGLALDIISCCFIACVCFSFILMDDGYTTGGSVGLAISQSLILTGMVQYGVRQSIDMISQMTSVERVLQYTNLPKEGSLVSEKPPPATWPSKGALVFKNVSMRYAAHKPPILKDLNLKIEPGWKIGIVGRTGAGKSSLISALFRLTGEGLDGEIVLDGINTKSIGLHELRPHISIIPQEPILFSASLRYNLDPFKQYTDAELWESLREVELGDAMSSLDFQVANGGVNLSVGQRQLICLARAILKNNRLLVLDEATANVDRSTDALIQNTIRRRFANCTVLTIAHRLNTIMDSDHVLVMERGEAVEFGHPHLLLKNPESHFSRMLQQTSKGMAHRLAEIAENAYQLGSKIREEELNDGVVTTSNNQITYL